MIRLKEKIKNYFKFSDDYIDGTKVYMFIHVMGKNVIFCTNNNGQFVNLYGQNVQITKAYETLKTSGRWGGGLEIGTFVSLNEEEEKKLGDFTTYLQKGFKYSNYLSINEIDEMSALQNKDNLMKHFKYKKSVLLDLENTLNKYLTENKPNVLSYRHEKASQIWDMKKYKKDSFEYDREVSGANQSDKTSKSLPENNEFSQ